MAGSAAPAWKAAVYAACRTLYASQRGVQVTYGHPGTDLENDLVVVGSIRMSPGAAPMSPARRREEQLELDVTFSCFRGGEGEAQQQATEAAYLLAAAFEEYARSGDITWAGTVRESVVAGHQLVESDESNIGQGRVAEVTFTLRAHARH